MPRHQRFALLLGGALALCTPLVGCDEECESGKTECVADSLARTCVPGADGNEWLVVSCSPGEVCVKAGEPVPGRAGGGGAADAGPDASASGGGVSAEVEMDACYGSCQVGEAECVGDALARVCTAGGAWSLDACELGERCQAGACVVSAEPGTVQRCEPGASACASGLVQKVCDADGTAWVNQACPANQVCAGGECVADAASSCDDGNRCLDNKTAIRCLGGDRGFELVQCAGDNYCEGGRCRGVNCQLGSTCNGTDPVSGNAQVRSCDDGVSFSDSECAAGQVCRQDKDTAACEDIACSVGETQCGDPADLDADATKTFTTCVWGAFSNVPERVRGTCAGDLVCTEGAFMGGNPCRSECTDGEQTCGSATGSRDGIRTCVGGVWGPVEPCNPDVAARRVCLTVPSDDPAALPARVCGEPVCQTAQAAICDGGRIRRCQPDGSLGDAEDCEAGVCRNVGGVQDDGRIAGQCDLAPECEAGEESCVPGTGSRYRTCVDGEWSQDYQLCAGGTACDDYTDDDGLQRKLCGDECVPNARRCDPDDLDGKAVLTCLGDGTWSGGEDCPVGFCEDIGIGSDDALCLLECVPGSIRCSGVLKLAGDGVHNGNAGVRTCQADGSWADETACAGAETCRTAASGEVLGCVECVGTDAPGGNAEGVADSYCPATDSVRSCGADNTWALAEACPDGTSCAGSQAPACGSCNGPLGGVLPVCTNAAGIAEPYCAPCVAAGGAACTATNIAGNDGTDCSDVGDAAAGSSYGGEADCCASAQTTYGGYNVETNWCPSSAWAGELDCCLSAQQGGGGASVAECVE